MNYPAVAISFLIAVALTPMVRLAAIRRGWTAKPKADRWHKKPTALMGGIAIYLALAGPLWFEADFQSLWQVLSRMQAPAGPPSFSAVAWIGISLLFVLGWVDDILQIKPQTKLIGQIIVAAMVVFFGYRLHWLTSMTLDTMISLVWIIGITNAFNLLDNMDGLCAGIAAICALSLAWLFHGRMPDASHAALLLAGALLGFLVYNTNPASIFMGDCGSLPIGFSVAMLSLYYAEAGLTHRLGTIAVPVLVLMVPVLDTSLVTIIRVLSGRKASTGGCDHTSHRLVLMGLSERRAVWVLYTIGAISGLAAFFVSRSDTLTSPTVIIPVALSLLLMGIYMAQLRIYPEKEFSRLRDRSFTPVLLELTYKRQLALVLLDFMVVAFCYYLAYRLRFDQGQFPHYFDVFLSSLPAVIACKVVVFFITGLYRGIWDYISTSEVYNCIKASVLASILCICAVTFIYRFKDFSKGVFIIDWVLTTGTLLGARGSFRLFRDAVKRQTLCGERVIIYGAGRGGELLLREILNNRRLNVQPIGFIDDDPLKRGKKLQGFPVLGSFEHLESLHQKYAVNGLLISFNHKDDRVHQAAKAFCKKHQLFLKRFKIELEAVLTGSAPTCELEPDPDDHSSTGN